MGPLLVESVSIQTDAERARQEAAIVALCERDRWSAAVIGCVASSTEPTAQDCMSQLPPEVRASYILTLDKSEEEGPAEDEVVTCDDAFSFTEVDLWAPRVDVEAERWLAKRLRGPALRQLCRDQAWDDATFGCMKASTSLDVHTCFDDGRRAAIARIVTEVDTLRQKIMKASEKPANVTCGKVVAAYYTDARWVGKAPELKGAARTKVIAAARKSMLASCGRWSLTTRACMMVVTDSQTCFALEGITPWGYPPIATTGIAECDEYLLAIEKLKSCSSLPEETKRALVDAYTQAAEAWRQLTPGEVEGARSACKAAAEATRTTAASCT